MGVSELQAAAAAQHGLVLVGDMEALGISRTQRRRFSAAGWLTEVRRGVLLVGGGRPTDWQKVVAAAMVAGPRGAVSHSTAARVHRFAGVAPGVGRTAIELTVPAETQPRLADCTLHRVLHLDAEGVVMHRGVRVTSPVRTLIDMTPRLPAAVIEKTVDEGLIARLWDETELVAAIGRARGRPGVGTLRQIMAIRYDGSAVDTNLELMATRALRSLGPFETGHQVVIAGKVYVLDIAWPAYKVAVECDGWTTRRLSRSKFDHDRRKDNDLTSHGWTVVHLTSAMSADEMRAAVVRALLQAAGRRAG